MYVKISYDTLFLQSFYFVHHKDIVLTELHPSYKKKDRILITNTLSLKDFPTKISSNNLYPIIILFARTTI